VLREGGGGGFRGVGGGVGGGGSWKVGGPSRIGAGGGGGGGCFWGVGGVGGVYSFGVVWEGGRVLVAGGVWGQRCGPENGWSPITREVGGGHPPMVLSMGGILGGVGWGGQVC